MPAIINPYIKFHPSLSADPVLKISARPGLIYFISKDIYQLPCFAGEKIWSRAEICLGLGNKEVKLRQQLVSLKPSLSAKPLYLYSYMYRCIEKKGRGGLKKKMGYRISNQELGEG